VNLIDGGQSDAGLAGLEQALAAHRATGADFQSSYHLTRLADAHARAGRLDAALDRAERALREIETSGERWWQAEAWRAKGEILSGMSPARAAEAEACLCAALECAPSQGARLWELHAALALAALWSRQGRRRDAAAALAPIGAAFGDAARLPKLEAAKAILAADHDA
jgi:predicted ATPase